MRKVMLLFLLAAIPMSVSAQNIIRVATSGGDFNDPVAALEAIGTTLPAASAGNRYLVQVEPGVYLVNNPVVMKPFVDLEGSGVKTTVVRGAIGSNFPATVQGIVNAASQSEIRHLTIRNVWSNSSAVGLLVESTQGAQIKDVRAVATGSAMDNTAWKYGILVRDSRGTRLSHVTARGNSDDPTACQGIATFLSSVLIQDSRLIGRGAGCTFGIGINASEGSSVGVEGSRIRGAGSINGISISGNSNTAGETTAVRARHSVLSGQLFGGTPGEAGTTELRVSHSELNGPVTGNVACFSVHDPDLNPLDAPCMP